MIRMRWSYGAMMLHVKRATTPERKTMQATEKSGVFGESGASGALSGATHAEKQVTDTAGPKMAAND